MRIAVSDVCVLWQDALVTEVARLSEALSAAKEEQDAAAAAATAAAATAAEAQKVRRAHTQKPHRTHPPTHRC
jgi:ribosomal protein L12E/L44/L45/RPP1/RPP2